MADTIPNKPSTPTSSTDPKPSDAALASTVPPVDPDEPNPDAPAAVAQDPAMAPALAFPTVVVENAALKSGKKYRVKSGKHYFIDNEGVERVAVAGQEVPPYAVNLTSMPDRFEAF